MEGKYPTPSPGQSNGNSSHGTSQDTVKQGNRGTMGTSPNAGAPNGPKK